MVKEVSVYKFYQINSLLAPIRVRAEDIHLANKGEVTILGDGRVVLIMDVIKLMEEVRHYREHEEKMEVQHA